MAQDPEKIMTFQAGMAGLDLAIPVVGHFDFGVLAAGEGDGRDKEKEMERVQLVDVGGGHGACLKQILEKHQQLDAKKCVLQDRPDVVEMARAGGLLPEGVVLMAHDFRTEQPVKGSLIWSLCLSIVSLLFSYIYFGSKSAATASLTQNCIIINRCKSVLHAYDYARLF